MKHIPTFNFKFNPVTMGLAIGIVKVVSDVVYGTACACMKHLTEYLDKKVEEKIDEKKSETVIKDEVNE